MHVISMLFSWLGDALLQFGQLVLALIVAGAFMTALAVIISFAARAMFGDGRS